MKIQAAVLHQTGGPLQVETLDLAEPVRGEVLVKLAAAGVCRSDWHVITGATRQPLPVVPGHEGAGIVQSVGPGVDQPRVGDLVTLNWAPACGDCFYCRRGQPNLCSTYLASIWAGTMPDGKPRLSLAGRPVFHYCALAAFAEFVVVPAAACVTMDPSLPPRIAAIIGCAVATGVGAVLNTAQVAAGSSVAVFGAGGVGLNMIQAARLARAATIIAVDPQPARRQLARRLGATADVPAGANAVSQVRELTDGRGADYVFEAVGDPLVQQQCLAAVRPGGSIVMSGLAPMGSEARFPTAEITREEKRLLGSYYGSTVPPRDFPRFAQYYLEGSLDLDCLITRTYGLSQVNEAFVDMQRGDGVRGVIVFDS